MEVPGVIPSDPRRLKLELTAGTIYRSDSLVILAILILNIGSQGSIVYALKLCRILSIHSRAAFEILEYNEFNWSPKQSTPQTY